MFCPRTCQNLPLFSQSQPLFAKKEKKWPLESRIKQLNGILVHILSFRCDLSQSLPIFVNRGKKWPLKLVSLSIYGNLCMINIFLLWSILLSQKQPIFSDWGQKQPLKLAYAFVLEPAKICFIFLELAIIHKKGKEMATKIKDLAVIANSGKKWSLKLVCLSISWSYRCDYYLPSLVNFVVLEMANICRLGTEMATRIGI